MNNRAVKVKTIETMNSVSSAVFCSGFFFQISKNFLKKKFHFAHFVANRIYILAIIFD